MNKAKFRSKRGTGLVECVVIGILLVPLAFCLLDVLALVMVNTMNDNFAKTAARAAANMDQAQGQAAAMKAIPNFYRNSQLWQGQSMTLDLIPNQSITCTTKVLVTLPVPFPGIKTVLFSAADVEPILVKQ